LGGGGGHADSIALGLILRRVYWAVCNRMKVKGRRVFTELGRKRMPRGFDSPTVYLWGEMT